MEERIVPFADAEIVNASAQLLFAVNFEPFIEFMDGVRHVGAISRIA